MSKRLVMGILFSAVVSAVVAIGNPSCAQESAQRDREHEQKLRQLMDELKSTQRKPQDTFTE